MTKFFHFQLRTTHPEAARAFYSALFGHDRAEIWPLHEQALARGARPHWLGNLGVADLDRALSTFVQRGATRLGPINPTSYGGEAAVLRDPGGAVLALSTLPPEQFDAGVTVNLHALNTNDVARAQVDYCELFGWALGERLELGAQGSFQQFAWQASGPNVGVMADIAGRVGVHPHWLFFFEVLELEPALALTRSLGGHSLEVTGLASGERLAVCDDAQGAAFGLIERAPRT